MESISALKLPLVLSAVIVFIASWIMHTLLPIHRGDHAKLPKEDEVMEALRRFDLPPGDYVVPHANSMEGMKSAEYKDKRNKGPVIMMTVLRNGPPRMAASLVQWFLYCLLVSLFAAYISGRALPYRADYLHVFRFAGATAFCGYSLALMSDSIWFQKKWSTTLKYMFDGLVYALLTGGTFGWLWPR